MFHRNLFPNKLGVGILLLFFASCSSSVEVAPSSSDSSEARPIEELKSQSPPTIEPVALPERVVAPWEVCAPMPEVESLIRDSRFQEAIELLNVKEGQNFQTTCHTASLRLKLGQPDEALAMVSAYVAAQKIEPESIAPELSLTTAFAYKAKRDIDQTFAWLSLTLRKPENQKTFSAAEGEAKNLLARISNPVFSSYALKWKQDLTLLPLIREEESRRRNGGQPIRIQETDYFSPSTYGLSAAPASPGTPSVTQPTEIILVISPKGRTSSRTEELKNGVELALSALKQSSTELNIPEVDVANLNLKVLTTNELSSIEVGNIQSIIDSKEYSSGSLSADFSAPMLSLSSNEKLTTVGRYLALTPSSSDELAELHSYAQATGSCEEIFILLKAGQSAPQGVKSGDFAELEQVLQAYPTGASVCLLTTIELEENLEKFSSLKSLRPQIKFFGGSSWLDPALLQLSKELFEGAFIVTPYYHDSVRGPVRSFVSAYMQRFHTEPGLAAALAYDGANIAALLTSKRVIESQDHSIDLQTVTGVENISIERKAPPAPLQFGISRRRFVRLMLKEGELEEQSAL